MDCLFIVRDPENGSIHQDLVDRDASYDTLFSTLKGALNLENFALYYNDEEGDEVRISSDAELRECFNIAEDNSVTFYIVPQAAKVEPPKPKEAEKEKEPVQFSPEWIGKQIPVLQQFVGEFLKKDHPLGNLISELTGESCSELEKMASNAFTELNREVSKFQEELTKEKEVKKEVKKVDEEFPAIHTHVYCDACNEQIVGIRYKCVNCVDYDLCQSCEEENLKCGYHDPEHLFLKVYKPVSLPTHRAFPSFYNRPAGSHGWMGWRGDVKRSCPWRNRAEKPERKERCQERKHKFSELEQAMQELKREIKELKEEKQKVAIPEPEEPVVSIEVVPEPVEEPLVAPEPEEVNLLEQSMAGLSPELLEVFEQIVSLGFTDYRRIAELVREHNGDINVIVMELLKEMR